MLYYHYTTIIANRIRPKSIKCEIRETDEYGHILAEGAGKNRTDAKVEAEKNLIWISKAQDLRLYVYYGDEVYYAEPTGWGRLTTKHGQYSGGLIAMEANVGDGTPEQSFLKSALSLVQILRKWERDPDGKKITHWCIAGFRDSNYVLEAAFLGLTGKDQEEYRDKKWAENRAAYAIEMEANRKAEEAKYGSVSRG